MTWNSRPRILFYRILANIKEEIINSILFLGSEVSLTPDRYIKKKKRLINITHEHIHQTLWALGYLLSQGSCHLLSQLFTGTSSVIMKCSLTIIRSWRSWVGCAWKWKGRWSVRAEDNIDENVLCYPVLSVPKVKKHIIHWCWYDHESSLAEN